MRYQLHFSSLNLCFYMFHIEIQIIEAFYGSGQSLSLNPQTNNN